MYDVMMADDEAKRKARIEARAKELREGASLPPRMQVWEDSIGKKNKLERQYYNDFLTC